VVDFHSVASYDFLYVSRLHGETFDVISIHGLRPFEQALHDLLNAVAVLRPNGLIVIDDVLPSSQDAALRSWPEAMALRGAAPGLGVN